MGAKAGPLSESLLRLKALANTVSALKEAERLALLGPEQIRLLRRYEQALYQCRPEDMKESPDGS